MALVPMCCSSLPVRARRDTFGYRALKFVRRHRGGVIAAALVSLALIVGMVTTLWQWRRAQNHLADALMQSARAEQVSVFLVDLFEISDPGEALANDVPHRPFRTRRPRSEGETLQKLEIGAGRHLGSFPRGRRDPPRVPSAPESVDRKSSGRADRPVQ